MRSEDTWLQEPPAAGTWRDRPRALVVWLQRVTEYGSEYFFKSHSPYQSGPRQPGAVCVCVFFFSLNGRLNILYGKGSDLLWQRGNDGLLDFCI